MSELTQEEIEALAAIEAAPEVASEMPRVSTGSALPPLDRFIDAEALKKDVSVNLTDLDSAMMTHASLYVHYAQQTVNARRQYDRLKNAFEILEAKLDAFHREKFAAEGKKVTESAIHSALVADPRWSSAQGRVIEANSIWRMCEVAESALVQRKDMILEIARDRRKEREGELRVLEQKGLRDAVLEATTRKQAA